MAEAGPLLEVKDLSVDIATADGVLHAVRNVEFSLNRSETLCIVGESGCGKSLTALALMGLLPHRAKRSAGVLRFDDADLLTQSSTTMRRLRGDRMSMIFQEPMTSLNPAFTIGDQIIDVMRQHRDVDTAQARERALQLFDRVGISAPQSRLRQYPHELSGGLRQRMLIAMALMCGPDLLLADEPTTALDVTIQAELLRLLAELRSELGMAMIFITHDLGLVSRIADRVAVMYAGEIVESAPVEDLFDDPLHPYTQGLLACLPVPGTTPRSGRLPSIPGVVPSLIGARLGCSFRDRCRFAVDACAAGEISIRSADERHDYRCLRTPMENRAGRQPTQSARP
jgi:peptide/nickel transport system ATP-binding protein